MDESSLEFASGTYYTTSVPITIAIIREVKLRPPAVGKPSQCPINEHPTDCVNACSTPTCSDPRPPDCNFLVCNKGCECNEGYVRTRKPDGPCIPIARCISFAEASAERQFQQWLMQLRIRAIPQEILTNKSVNNNTLTARAWEFVAPFSVIDISSKQTECAKDQFVRKSGLPLVQLGDGFYYFGTYFKSNYFGAMQFCSDHGMDLVSIETNEENSRIINYIITKLSAIDHFWTSGSDLGEEGHFVWLSTGQPLNFTYWSPPQPDNAGNIEDCVEIWKLGDKHYIWNDVPCTANFHFICEVRKCSDFCINSN